MNSLKGILTAVAERFDLHLGMSDPAGGGFSGAEVFRVVASDGRKFAFRKFPPHAALPEERLRALHKLLSAVHRSGMSEIPVPLLPQSIRAGDSAPVLSRFIRDSTAEIDPWIRIGPDLWQVEPWMPGSPVSVGVVNHDQLQSALLRLRMFHTAAVGYVSQGHQSVWFRDTLEPSPAILRRQRITEELLNGRMDTLSRLADADPDPRFRNSAISVCQVLSGRLRWLHLELTGLTKQPFAVQPVLRDVWSAHVLFTDDCVTGLIDLSAAATDHVGVDASRLLRSFFGTDTSLMTQAIAEFESQPAFNRAERLLYRALDASSVLLSPVTWIQRRADNGMQGLCPPEMLARFEKVTSIARAFKPLPIG